MLSGIASLEWKWVKNAGQHLRLLFTGAQKAANFACDLCSTCWEKDPRVFGKVVEGSVVHNFGIETLDHFCWKNWRKTLLNKATWNYFAGAWRSRALAIRRRRARRARPPRSSSWALTPRHASAHRSMRRSAMPPPGSPSPRAPRVYAAPHNQWLCRRTPPRVIAVHAPRRPWAAIGHHASHRLCAIPCPLPRGTGTYKRSRARRSRALRSCRAAAAAPWVPRTSSSRVRSFSQPCSHAWVFPRPRWRACRLLLPRPGHILTGATAPAAAVAWPRHPCPPATSPRQVSALVESSRALDPPQPLLGRARRRGRRNCSRPRRP
jgi:hypothetical protein